MIIDYEEVGARMKARRLFLGLSLNEAGKRMGVTATTLKRWEDGYVKSIKTTKMLMIANALETTPETLFGMEEKVLPINGVEAVPAMRALSASSRRSRLSWPGLKNCRSRRKSVRRHLLRRSSGSAWRLFWIVSTGWTRRQATGGS